MRCHSATQFRNPTSVRLSKRYVLSTPRKRKALPPRNVQQHGGRHANRQLLPSCGCSRRDTEETVRPSEGQALGENTLEAEEWEEAAGLDAVVGEKPQGEWKSLQGSLSGVSGSLTCPGSFRNQSSSVWVAEEEWRPMRLKQTVGPN